MKKSRSWKGGMEEKLKGKWGFPDFHEIVLEDKQILPPPKMGPWSK